MCNRSSCGLIKHNFFSLDWGSRSDELRGKIFSEVVVVLYDASFCGVKDPNPVGRSSLEDRR